MSPGFSSFWRHARLIGCLGTGKVTCISVTMTAVALFGFSASPSFLWLCLLAVPFGLGAGAVDAALNNFVALHYKARHMSWLHCFWGVGATAGPIIMSVFIAADGGWQKGYLEISMIQFCLAFLLLVTLPIWAVRLCRQFSDLSFPEQRSSFFPISYWAL